MTRRRSYVRRRPVAALLAASAAAAGLLAFVSLRSSPAAPATAGSVTAFESGLVRPLALSPDGSRLFAVNTPDARLEVFAAGQAGLTHETSIPVGLEPVAVAARSASEVWVVNHLSDSVSVVDVASVPPRVVRTLLVGDEPRDLVFAGPGRSRAFITCAHRGQNAPFDPQLQTPGVGRADVWVFDTANLGPALGGTPLTIVTLYGDTPRALAASPDGSRVYAGIFHSGNRTTTVHEGAIPDGGPSNGGLPAPTDNADGVAAPEVGLIVKFDGVHWIDPGGTARDDKVKFSLPDRDVFVIDADADPPVESGSFAGVGTTLFNLAVHPVTGDVYVSNTDARNEVRFEGPGVHGGSTVRGHLAESRITVIRDGQVLPRHLNKHVDYAVVPGPPGENAKSLAIPLDLAMTSDGATLYVAAFGSSKVGVFATSQLVDDSFVPDTAHQIAVTGGGPSGLALDEARHRLYVLTRFDNAISIVDTASQTETAHVPLFDPEPPAITAGRRFLYDAALTSGHGDSACASCHVFGDMDHLAWDLGNPDASVIPNPNPFRVPAGGTGAPFHPMKGPMTTQSLRGLAGAGPMHWRGDRTGGNDPGGDPLDENAAFLKFNVAFEGLLGRAGPLTDAQMQAFANFILQVTYPPNPIRRLDNSLTAAQARGRDFFLNAVSDGGNRCVTCHALDRAKGFFGTDGFSSFEGETQEFKIAHLRNVYQKIGMFGFPDVLAVRPGDNGDQGPQVRGFGFAHDGSIDTLARFLRSLVFQFGDDPVVAEARRHDVAEFLLAFDSDLAPIVGQQVTLTATNGAIAGPRIDLMIQRCSLAPAECDLVVKGNLSGEARGWRLVGGGFLSDRASDAPRSDASLRSLAATAGQELTYTAMPPGSGIRAGVDRDEDSYLDRDELDAGSDPANAQSIPVDSDGDGTPNASDCAPDDPSIHPGAPEICNGLDDDCSGAIDEGLPTTTWHRDADGDGFGAAAPTVTTCDGAPPVGYVADATDCNDADASIHPGAAESCNGLDDNCSGAVDEGLSSVTWHRDGDGDGFGAAAPTVTTCDGVPPAGYVADATDCNDADASIHPGAAETCDGVDNDCHGTADDPACADYDLDGNGRIDGIDLAELGRAFGSCDADPESQWWHAVDFDHDGCVDGDDLAVLANLWATRCSGGVLACRSR